MWIMKFEERIQNLKDQFKSFKRFWDDAEIQNLLNDFSIHNITKYDWFEIAEEYGAKICSESGVSYRAFVQLQTDQKGNNGLMGRCISAVYSALVSHKLDYIACDTEQEVQKFIENRNAINNAVKYTMVYHNFTAKTIPPVLLVRELLILLLHLENTYESLQQDLSPIIDVSNLPEAIRLLQYLLRQKFEAQFEGFRERPEDMTVIDRDSILEIINTLT